MTAPALPAALTVGVALTLLVGGCAQAPGAASQASGTPSSRPPAASTSAPAPTRTTPTRTATRPQRPASTPVRTSATRTATANASQVLPPVPRSGAEPAMRFPANRAAVGAGANATVEPVPDSVWDRMAGYSWTPGCPVGRSALRYVSVNFWGFDGRRSRGSLVVNGSIAGPTAAAFSRLYDLRFRVRQIRPMDASWGRNPKGPGANDYAAMEADNTSAFNCRYVGGEEASKVYSKHAYGTAIDINDVENPYAAADGTVYPDSYWLHRRGTAPGVFSSSSSAAVRAFTNQGMRWGGLWSDPDFQHFEAP